MNELKLIFLQKQALVKAERDNRYRVMVSMKRSDRPKHWNFRCMNCSNRIAEIDNCDVYDISDFYDPNQTNYAGTTMHCKGVIPGTRGTMCPYSYFFNFG